MEISPEKLEVLREFLTDKSNGSTMKKKPLRGIAKYMTIFILIFTFAIAIFGSFVWADFKMLEFVEFLKVYAWFYIPLVGSIAVNSAVKTVKDKNIERDIIAKGQKDGN